MVVLQTIFLHRITVQVAVVGLVLLVVLERPQREVMVERVLHHQSPVPQSPIRVAGAVPLMQVEPLEQVVPAAVVQVELVLALSLELRILVVVAVVHLKETLLYLAAPASSSSRSTNNEA
jgi:hypothetical protein